MSDSGNYNLQGLRIGDVLQALTDVDKKSEGRSSVNIIRMFRAFEVRGSGCT